MTEQEWLEDMADQWMRDRMIMPAFDPGLPVVSECGWRFALPPVTGCTPLDRIRLADEVEFYAVFVGGREVTTRRRRNDMVQSV